MKLSIENLQYIFETDIYKLIETKEDDIKYLHQGAGACLVIETVNHDDERYNLLRHLDEFGGHIEVEYHGKLNGYNWETVLEVETNF